MPKKPKKKNLQKLRTKTKFVILCYTFLVEEKVDLDMPVEKKRSTASFWIIVIVILLLFAGVGYMVYAQVQSGNANLTPTAMPTPTDEVMMEPTGVIDEEAMEEEDVMGETIEEVTNTPAPTEASEDSPTPTKELGLQGNPSNTPTPNTPQQPGSFTN